MVFVVCVYCLCWCIHVYLCLCAAVDTSHLEGACEQFNEYINRLPVIEYIYILSAFEYENYIFIIMAGDGAPQS